MLLPMLLPTLLLTPTLSHAPPDAPLGAPPDNMLKPTFTLERSDLGEYLIPKLQTFIRDSNFTGKLSVEDIGLTPTDLRDAVERLGLQDWRITHRTLALFLFTARATARKIAADSAELARVHPAVPSADILANNCITSHATAQRQYQGSDATADVEAATADVETATADVEAATADIEPATADVEAATADVEPATADIAAALLCIIEAYTLFKTCLKILGTKIVLLEECIPGSYQVASNLADENRILASFLVSDPSTADEI
ncbi:hypothetical protein VTK26DRAFT_2109 [Humicola hyalothermophila]